MEVAQYYKEGVRYIRVDVNETRELAWRLAELSIRLADECDAQDQAVACEGAGEDDGAGWCLKTSVFPGRVHVYLMHGGKLEASGVSYIKEDVPECVAISQAFSYAAHLIYKDMQRRAEFGGV